MKQDWETKRYTLDNLDEKNGILNEKSHNTDWLGTLLKTTNWNNIESVIVDGNLPLLTKEQILSIRTNLNSAILEEIKQGYEEIRNVLYNLILYLYTDLHLEENEAAKELDLAEQVEDVEDLLQVLDILAVIPPEIQVYVKICLNVKTNGPEYHKTLPLITERYSDLFGITLIWILENFSLMMISGQL